MAFPAPFCDGPRPGQSGLDRGGLLPYGAISGVLGAHDAGLWRCWGAWDKFVSVPVKHVKCAPCGDLRPGPRGEVGPS